MPEGFFDEMQRNVRKHTYGSKPAGHRLWITVSAGIAIAAALVGFLFMPSLFREGDRGGQMLDTGNCTAAAPADKWIREMSDEELEELVSFSESDIFFKLIVLSLKKKRVMKAKFIYVFLTCLMIGGQFSLSAQNQVNKDKRQRHTPEQFMERQTNQMVNTLMLDDAAAARFVPVYQNYLKELRECRMMNRRQLSSGQGTEQKGMKPQPKSVLTDAEMEQQIKGRFAQSRKILDVREKYYDEFRKILSPKQIMKIYRTEQNNANKLKKEFDRRKKQAVAQENINTRYVLHRSLKLPEKLWFNIISVS